MKGPYQVLLQFERTSTAVVSAYLQPLIDRYLRALAQQLWAKGYERIFCSGNRIGE